MWFRTCLKLPLLLPLHETKAETQPLAAGGRGCLSRTFSVAQGIITCPELPCGMPLYARPPGSKGAALLGGGVPCMRQCQGSSIVGVRSDPIC